MRSLCPPWPPGREHSLKAGGSRSPKLHTSSMRQPSDCRIGRTSASSALSSCRPPTRRTSTCGSGGIFHSRYTQRQVFSQAPPPRPSLSRSLEGLVGQIRHVVNVEDSFTRMNLEREPERKAHQAKYETALEAKQKKAAARAA